MSSIIQRNFYLDQLIKSMWNSQVKVVTGIRRCGKSVLLFDLFYNYLINHNVSDNEIIKIKLDERRYYQYRNPITLCEYIESIVERNKDKKFYLLIDEVQFTLKVKDNKYPDIEVTIYDMLNELRSYKNLDVYVTGSNSHGLSSDILTQFRGRASQIRVYPLSFDEIHSCSDDNATKTLENYMLYGGMPALLSLNDDSQKKDYLSYLYEEVYIKDIVERNKIERTDILNKLLDFLASQISSLTNPSNIASSLQSAKDKSINSALITNYIQYTIDAFLIHVAKRFDIKGKSYFKYPNKYYYTDVGLRNARVNYRQYDPGHLMENIIYLDLIRRGYKVDIGIIKDRSKNLDTQREIDFVVNDVDKKTYIQSAFQINTDSKLSSEISSFLAVKDFFKKIVVRMDITHSFWDDHGIFHCNLIDFLLGKVNIF